MLLKCIQNLHERTSFGIAHYKNHKSVQNMRQYKLSTLRVQYWTDHIIKLNAMQTRSMRSSTVIDWTRQSLCRLPLKIKEHIGCAVSSCLMQENVCCPKFQNTSLVGNFSPQIRLPDGHFGQFWAIGPMDLLRPDIHVSLKTIQHSWG